MTASRTQRLLVTAAAAVDRHRGVEGGERHRGPALPGPVADHRLPPAAGRPGAAAARRGSRPSWCSSAPTSLILVLALSLVVAIGRLAVLIPTYAPELNGYVEDAGSWLHDAGVGERPGRGRHGTQSTPAGWSGWPLTCCPGSWAILSDLFFLVALLLFLAFDSAKRAGPGRRRPRGAPRLVDAMGSFARGTRSYLAVTTVFGLIVAVVDTGLLWALGVPAAFVWGVLAFVTNFIPNIGFVIGLVPPALIALLEGGPKPDARRDRHLLRGQRGHPVGDPASRRRERGGALHHAHLPVAGVLGLDAGSARCPPGRPDEPVLPGRPGGGGPGRAAGWSR